MTVQEKFGFHRVVNARGPATIFGAAKVSKPIRQDISDILSESVQMSELQRIASRSIAQLTGTEAGCVVHCTAAGMAVATAAVLAGRDAVRIKSLPDITWPKRKIIIQKGQVTGAGDCPVWQVIKMCGAEYIEIGEALDCATFHLKAALDENTAAAFFIMEDTFAPNLLQIETFVSICHSQGVPVICDAAYLTDFELLGKLGVDMAIYSGHKWLGGCTSGFIAGRKEYIHACYMQEMGVGRPMKAGKEGIISIISSINEWLSRDEAAIKSFQTDCANLIMRSLNGLTGVRSEIMESQYSPSVRVHIQVDYALAGVSAVTINEALLKSDPVIVNDDYYVNQGKLIFDMAYLDSEDAATIGNAIRELLSLKKLNVETQGKESAGRTRQDILYEWFDQWMDVNL